MQRLNLKIIDDKQNKLIATSLKNLLAVIICSSLQISALALPVLSIFTTSCGSKGGSTPALPIGPGGTGPGKVVRYRIEIVSDENPSKKIVIEKSAEELESLISE